MCTLHQKHSTTIVRTFYSIDLHICCTILNLFMINELTKIRDSRITNENKNKANYIKECKYCLMTNAT